MISLSGGPDVGYGGDCGTVEPPTVTKSGWWRTLPALWRHAGDKDAAPKTGPGVNDNDRLTGGKGDDALFGGPGADRLVGGSGADYLSGGSGHDRLVGGPGRNRIEAGGGSDSVNSANGVRELVDCGFGRDTVTADRRDVLSGCERVKRVRRRSKKDPVELLPECPGGGHECHKDESGTVVLSGSPARAADSERRHVLPDVLEPGLRIVFCGTAAGAVAARVGAPYAGPGNRFWWVLHEIGLTPRELQPSEFRDLPRYGIGLTDVAKYTSGSDSSLARTDFDSAAVIEKVERYAPGILAFVGKRAAREVLGGSLDYGPQDVRIGVSRRLGRAVDVRSGARLVGHKAVARPRSGQRPAEPVVVEALSLSMRTVDRSVRRPRNRY